MPYEFDLEPRIPRDAVDPNSTASVMAQEALEDISRDKRLRSTPCRDCPCCSSILVEVGGTAHAVEVGVCGLQSTIDLRRNAMSIEWLIEKDLDTSVYDMGCDPWML